MKKIIFKIWLGISILIISTILIFIIWGAIESYKYGCPEGLDIDMETYAYGIDAVKNYLEFLPLVFLLWGSILGVIPILIMPILILIINIKKCVIIDNIKKALVICIVLHIILFVLKCLINYNFELLIYKLLCILPYIECVLISCILSNKIKEEEIKDS